jgi:hypothetical protein
LRNESDSSAFVHFVGAYFSFFLGIGESGIPFIATSEDLDANGSDPASKLITHILAAVVQSECELITNVLAPHEGGGETYKDREPNWATTSDHEEVVRLPAV